MIPTITQPLLYKAIKEHPPLWEIYAEDIGVEDAQARVQKIRAEFEAAQKKAGSLTKKPTASRSADILGQLQRRPLQGGV